MYTRNQFLHYRMHTSLAHVEGVGRVGGEIVYGKGGWGEESAGKEKKQCFLKFLTLFTFSFLLFFFNDPQVCFRGGLHLHK